jgi:hypothetical protein
MFQASAFQNNAFQIALYIAASIAGIADYTLAISLPIETLSHSLTIENIASNLAPEQLAISLPIASISIGG